MPTCKFCAVPRDLSGPRGLPLSCVSEARSVTSFIKQALGEEFALMDFCKIEGILGVAEIKMLAF